MSAIRSASLAVGVLVMSAGAWAQVTDPTPETTPPIELDGTLGDGGDVPFDGTTWTVHEDLGDYNDSGTSLFHSFGRFDIPGSQQAVFTAETGAPKRVFARVTWDEPSQIDGILDYSAIPGADFYLINPAGIHFGANGQVRSDQGSFYATTASQVRFAEGDFTVEPPSPASSILALESPVAFGFLGTAAPVTIAGGDVRPVTASDDRFHTATFAAVGGDVEMAGGSVATFDSPGSQLALVAAAPGVEVPHDLGSFDPTAVSPGVQLGSVVVSDASIVAAPPAGSVLVRGGSFAASDARLSAVHRGDADSGFARVVDVLVQRDLTFERSSVLVGSADDGFGGDIRLDGAEVHLIDSQVTGETRGAGAGIDIEVQVDAETGRLEVSGTRLVSLARGEGGAGDVTLSGGIIEIVDGAEVGSTTLGPGDAGAVTVTGEQLTVRGGPTGASVLNSRSAGSASPLGAGGPLLVDVGRLELLDGGQVTASTAGREPAGDVRIVADDVLVAGVDPLTGANESGVFAQTVAQGDVDAGAGGSITITSTGDVRVADGGRVAVETRNRADAGNVAITADGAIRLDRGGRVSALSGADSSGQSGSISLRAVRGVYLSQGASISAQANGTGDAGTIGIDAGPELVLVDSAITTDAQEGGGGQITVLAADAVRLTDSSISTSVQRGGSVGDGGDVRIDPDLVVLNRSEILANAQDGNGGRIFIRAGAFIESTGSRVRASSLGGGIDGTVIIESPDSDLTAETTPPPQQYLDAAALLGNACAAVGASESSLVVSRVAGLPATPEGPLPARLWDDAWIETRVAAR